MLSSWIERSSTLRLRPAFPGALVFGAIALLLAVSWPAASRPVSATVLPPADEAASRIRVPPGFAIRIFAQGLTGTPRLLAFGPDGHLYVTLLNAGQIVRLPDRNADGSIPADVKFGPDGAMYISDDAAGRVYRVVSLPLRLFFPLLRQGA